MIWIVMTRTDTDNYVSERNARFIKEALGNEVRIISVTKDTDLSFIDSVNDIVIAQTRDRDVLNHIVETGARNTVESEKTVLLTKDKEIIKAKIEKLHLRMRFAKTLKEGDPVEEGKAYFVKPRFGEDSNGVDERSKCHTARQIEEKCRELREMGYEPIVEEYIDGEECTVALLREGEGLQAYPVAIDLPTEFVTHEVKFSENEICRMPPMGFAYSTFNEMFRALMPDCHYMRVDYRVKDGEVYLIDLNLFPGLGPIDHFAKCVTINSNMSYRGVLRLIASTADRKAKSTNSTR